MDHKADMTAEAVSLIRYLCVTETLFAYAMVAFGAMQGAGDTVRPMWISLFSLWGIRVPLAFILALPAGFPITSWLRMPFGAGLGYTTFELDPGSLTLERHGPASTSGTVAIDVANTGDRTGSTVVFLFAGRPGSAFARPIRRLVGFARVTRDPGEQAPVALAFDVADLAVRRDGGWFQEPGRYRLEVGTDAGTVVATVAVDLPDPG